VFFVGDSFTPTGIDDYCLQNRDFLHEGQGFLTCLERLEKLPADCLIVNQHVSPAFRFSAGQVAQMKQALRERFVLLHELMPFDDPNYGLDESWAALRPYWITAHPGDKAKFELRITNHSPRPRTFRPLVRAPQNWKVTSIEAEEIQIPSHRDGMLSLMLALPDDAKPGLVVITTDVRSEGIDLREWSELVVEVTGQGDN
jgi:hypothetical protein